MINRYLINITEWAQKWKVTFNAEKSKDIIFSSKTLNNSPPIIFNNTIIKRVNEHKHLGIFLSSSLDWSRQIHEMCLKANKKLSILKSIKYSNRQTLDVLYKLTVRSVIDCALPLFYNSLKHTEKVRIDNIQYRAAKIVTGAYHLTSQQRLNKDLGWETIQCRSNILGLNIFHKIHMKETRPLIWSCMPKKDLDRIHFLRSKCGYLPFSSKNAKFSNSFFPYFSKLWNTLDKKYTNRNLEDFKLYTKSLKPKKVKHFNRREKITNSHLTRIRVGRSDLNQQKFSIGLVDTPECLCHSKEESPKHYFLDCFLYTQERQNLFSLIGHYIPKFQNMSNTDKLNIILFGYNYENDEYSYVNTRITKSVQNYIARTKRFD